MEIKNDGRLKICWMRIVGYQQFQDVFLDFTHPETGEPLDKICLIGANGTGKTTILHLIFRALNFREEVRSGHDAVNSLIVTKLQFEGFSIYRWDCVKSQGYVEDESEIRLVESALRMNKIASAKLLPHISQLRESDRLVHNEGVTIDLAALCEVESIENPAIAIQNVPETTLDAALNDPMANKSFATVSPATVIEFWNGLLRHLHYRNQKRMEFLQRPENRTRTVGELDDEFDQYHPKILDKLAPIWNRILAVANLEFDFANAYIPFSPFENLLAYIRLKSSHERISYQGLSTGIRNYIFRVGHLLTLGFNRELRRSFLLVDEPENGLFPDFLYGLVDLYREVMGEKDTPSGQAHTQMFFATHEPIIAAQFQPWERIILEWNDDGTVRTRRGEAPIGDDPNDLLKQDFAVSSLMGKEGAAAWTKYLQLRKQLQTEEDQTAKASIAAEFLALGRQYNFPAK